MPDDEANKELERRARDQNQERALKKTVADERKHRVLFESMPLGVVYHDADGKVLSANPAALRILGLSMDQLQGLSSMDPRWRSIHEDGSDYPGKDHPAMVALRTGQEVHDVIMGVFNPLDNAYRWLSINAVPLFMPGQSRPHQAYAAFTDITERKGMEGFIRDSERQYRLLFDEMLSGFALHQIICNLGGKPIDYRFLDVNAAFERQTGLKGEEIIGKTVLEAMPGTEPYWIDLYGKVALTGEPVQFENYSQELDRYYEVRAYSPRKGQFAVILNDITEHKKAEQQRQDMEAKIRQAQKMEAMGELAGGIAHDFNNILVPMMGFAEMLKEDIPAGTAQHEAAGHILTAALRAKDLVTRILSFSRQTENLVQPLKVQTILEEVLKLSRATLPASVEIVKNISNSTFGNRHFEAELGYNNLK